jgi:pilus assembly protein CpaE
MKILENEPAAAVSTAAAVPAEARRVGTLRIILADDSPVERAAIWRQLASPNVELVGEANLGPEAVQLVQQLKPNAVLVSFEEPLARAIRTIESIAMSVPETAVVAVSSLGDRDSLRRAMTAGSRDYLVRPFESDEVVRLIAELRDFEGKRRRLSEQTNGSGSGGTAVTVFGAKGGIGRTMLATNLAVALALQDEQRVALVDLDVHLGDVALLLGVAPERTLIDLIPVIDKLDSDLLRGYVGNHASGLKVLAAPSRPEDGEAIQPSHVRTILQVLLRTYDYVVIDTPRQLNDNVIAALDMSSLVCFVASNQLSCLKSTQLCLDMMLTNWAYSNDKVKLILNQAHNGSGVPLKEAPTAIDYPVFWKIPYDSGPVAAAEWGKPFVLGRPKAKISRNVTSLARVLAGKRARARSFLPWSRSGR